MRVLLFISFLTLSSCSSLKRQQFLGGVIGAALVGALGSTLGRELSPNRESERLNQTLGALGGASVGFFIGSQASKSFWFQDPAKAHLPTHLIDQQKEVTKKPKIKLLRPKDLKRIKLETKLPDFLKGRVKEANVIVYEIDSFEEETEDDRIIIHEPHKAYEYVLE